MITVNGNDLEWRDGLTVTDVLEAMNYTALVHITVFVDGEHVPQDDYDTHLVPDGAEVNALHIHHGG